MGDFNKQVIVCLASDLEETARAIANKERSARTSAIMRYGDWTGGMPQQRLSANGGDYRLAGSRSRLVIVAHGDENSRCINGSAALTGKTLAEFVAGLVDGPVDRVTLHICCGGGNTDAGVGPFDSIACEFARHAGGITREVTARTGVVAGTYYPNNLTGFKRSVGGRQGNARRDDDKVVFEVNPGSSLAAPLPPRRAYYTRKQYAT
jgi:hypothetical protein